VLLCHVLREVKKTFCLRNERAEDRREVAHVLHQAHRWSPVA
jgi:hypothetical protein